MSEQKGKLILMSTHGPENPELATIPFVMATAAQASDVEVVIGFQANGVMLARNGCAEHVFAAGFPPLKELMDIYLETGANCLYVDPVSNHGKSIQRKNLFQEQRWSMRPHL